ncbi:MAG: hypothetical protein AAF385_10250 [Pseudomonadota bacterium]
MIRPTSKSLGLRIAIVLTAVMVWRTSAIAYLLEVGNTVPEFWSIAFKGDSFIGLTAVFLAVALWKVQSPRVWLLGILWQVVGLVDLYVALETQLMLPLGAAPNIVIPVGIVMHTLALFLLYRNRGHYQVGF